MQNTLSHHPERAKVYFDFLSGSELTVNAIIQMGQRLMRKAKLHPHFFANNTLLATAQYLTFFALQLPHDYTNPDYLNLKLSESDATTIFHLFEKRIAERIPVEYLTQEATYLNRTFYVNEHVLVPRSVMNNQFRDFLNDTVWENFRVLDLCTGSGCVGISLALLHSEIQVDLVDISPDALNVAAINIERHGLQHRVRCIQSDLFENVKQKYDLIITNPPYVSSSEYHHSPAEFKNEPRLALESGWDGLDISHRILAEAHQYLNPHGKLIAEVGFPAARRLKRRYRRGTFKWLPYIKPNGKKPWLAMDCIFVCEAKQLPAMQVQTCNHVVSRWLDRAKDLF